MNKVALAFYVLLKHEAFFSETFVSGSAENGETENTGQNSAAVAPLEDFYISICSLIQHRWR